VKAGKAVYVEKPLTLDIHEGRVMADVVQRYGGIVQVGSQQRSDARFIQACELVRNGRIGELKLIKVAILARPGNANTTWAPQPVPAELNYDKWLGTAPWAPYHKDRCHYNFRFVTDYSGGDMTNWGAHHLDIAQMGVGADGSGPVKVVGIGKRNPNGIHDTFYDIAVDFTYGNGVVLRLRSFDPGPKIKTGYVQFEGTEGWVRVSREAIDAEPKSLLTSRIGPDEIHLSPAGEGSTHMGIWLDCVRSGSGKNLNVPVEVGHRSATLCHLANMSMELRRVLHWDPAAEEFADDDEANRQRQRPRRQPLQVG